MTTGSSSSVLIVSWQEFPDGSNPDLDLVRKFIAYADRVIEEGGKVAVHCKAGLGRTGVMSVSFHVVGQASG